AVVRRFRKAGWRVAACARALEHLAESPADFKFACDVADPDAVSAGVAAVVRELRTLAAPVNCAGLAGSNPVDADGDVPPGHRVVDVTLHGPSAATKHASAQVAGGGRLVSVGSGLSLGGAADQAAYSAAKHAVLGFTRALARQAAVRGVTVNLVRPVG